ncbi:MAG: proline/glycine betaine ABC transporter permease [Firmicutes bacterium]|nr:proline/glycine betaine ABC transporter permease [Bacillota bacterium]
MWEALLNQATTLKNLLDQWTTYLILYRLPLREWADFVVMYLRSNYRDFFRACSGLIEGAVNNIEALLSFIPITVFILVLVILAWRLSGRGMAVFTLVSLFLLVSMNIWDETIRTLALVLTATFMALLSGVPLGILASRSDLTENILRPILDFMQTMPIFVYLLPAVMFFSIGVVPAVLATVVFSMPPAIRLTNLGIRQVPAEMIEAAASFGSTPLQMLFKIQLPLALPSIMAGINQCIMLSLSMVVIAAMIGAGGLGGIVYRAITRLQIGSGFEGGLGVVIIAIILDRITQSVGKESPEKKAA